MPSAIEALHRKAQFFKDFISGIPFALGGIGFIDMIEALFNQSGYMATKKMLDMTVLREEAISSNMANLETPNYKRLDVTHSFQTELKRAIAGGNETQINSLKPTLAVDEHAVSSRGDGNTVQLEEELMQLNQNFINHSVETQLITQSLLKMRLAITGRPS